ncbi:MAG: pentapeptide repeat-containing protein [Cyanobacteria bacterium]|nr:pentapeptide repeat-containing protein [Cyanobacteriota bacterium]
MIHSGAAGLAALIQTSDAAQVVLVVDQFEEAFTLCQDPVERQQFFATLLGALAETPLRLIVAMRADFVGKCFEQEYSGLADKVQRHLEAVLPMTPAELTQAITAPAKQAGLSLEPGLVETLLKDVASAPGSLPLLQYTLTELWQHRQENQLKLSTYAQLGGVTGTLKQRADQVYEALTPEQQQTAKHIFLNLTQLGEGAEDTRRRINQASLVSANHSAEQVAIVAKQLADANLVVTDERVELDGQRSGTVDVAHEALIRNWPKLRHWLDENRDLLRQQRKIELAAQEWQQQGKQKQKGYLLQGRQLADANRFRKDHSKLFPLSPNAETYLNQSLATQRNTRLKFTALGLIVPLGLASYAGFQIATYFRLRPHWDLIYSYDPATNEIGNAAMIRSLREINGAEQSLRNITLVGADLRSADLRSADLSSADLRSANLSSADLSSADLSSANLSSANLSSANLGSANLSTADLRFADLRSADLRSADLRSADLRSADLNSANLSRANLRSADLSSADLSSADLRSADLRSALLGAADLREATNLVVEQLTGESPPYLCKVALPAYITDIDPDLDCDQFPQLLMERYGLSQEEAERRVNEMRNPADSSP